MARTFEGKVVVITGAAGGIGQALAREFGVRQGARLVLTDIDADRLEEARAALGDGVQVIVQAADVRDAAACQAVIDAGVARWGGIDVMINNAGMAHRSLFEDTSDEVLRRIIDVNLFGSIYCTRAALPSLLKRRGHVIALSSVAGVAPLVGRTGYAASKHALHGFFETLRAEVRRRGVHVLMVCPGFVDTPLNRRALGGDGQPVNRDRADGDPMSPDALAGAIAAATARRDDFLFPTALSRAAYLLSRLAPSVYERMMLRNQRDEFPSV